MASRVCWQCNRLSHMTRMGEAGIVRLPLGGNRYLAQAPFRCDNCYAMSIAMLRTPVDGGYGLDLLTAMLEDDNSQSSWLPERGVGKDFPDVPEHIAQAASEAHECRSIDALRGAVLLARSVVEATAKDRGFAQGKLEVKIDAMRKADIISQRVTSASHEIRHLGNDMAHGDFVEPVEEEDADEMLNFMGVLLDEVYQTPASIERAKAKREAKRAARSESAEG